MCRNASGLPVFAGFLWRFPQLDAIAFRVHDPGEAAVIGVFTLGIDPDACLAKRAQQRVQVGDAVIDHESRAAGAEVAGVFGKCRPGSSALLAAFQFAPTESSPLTMRLALDAEMLFIPAVQFFWIP